MARGTPSGFDRPVCDCEHPHPGGQQSRIVNLVTRGAAPHRYSRLIRSSGPSPAFRRIP